MSGKQLYVYSLLSSAVQYNLYGEAVEGGTKPIVGSVIVNGGAGVADKNFITPDGAVITAISAENAELIKQDPVFQLHEKNGYVRIDEAKLSGEQAAILQGSLRDPSAPLTAVDYEAQGAKAPTVNTADDGTDAPPPAPAKTSKTAK